MSPLPIVKKVDIFGDLGHRLATRLVSPMINELRLYGAEETVYRGIVVAVAFCGF